MNIRAPYLLIAALLTWGIFLAGCSPLERITASPEPPVGSCTLALPDGSGDEDAVRALLRAEGELVVSQEIERLMTLWAPGGEVVDAKNTPDNAEDDQKWSDKDAIRHRYVRIVFPGAPTVVTPADLKITWQSDRAEVISTTRIGSEVAPGGDRWVLAKQGKCWLIESLTYNLEPAN